MRPRNRSTGEPGGTPENVERGKTGLLAASFALAALGLAWGLAAAPRGYAEGDASELTLALALAGAPHPTGYPLYVLAGHLATSLLHGFGMSWPIAANAWSAVGSAVALFFLHRLGAAFAAPRLDAQGMHGFPRAVIVTIPFLPLVALPIWSAAASGAEVYSWHAAWVAWAAWSAWQAAARPWGRASSLLWGAVVGVGLAHHATSLLFSIPLTGWIWLRPGRTGGPLAVAAGALLPLLSWGWIAYRAVHPAAFQWPLLEPGPVGLFTHVLGAAYGGYLGGFHPSASEARLMMTAIPWIALSFAAIATASASRAASPMARARRSFARTLGAGLALQSAFVLAYRVPDPSAHLGPILAVGAIFLPDLAAALRARAGAAVLGLGAAALLLGLIPASIAFDLASRGSAEETDRIVRAAWGRIRFEEGFVFWNNDLYARLRAYQILEGSHPGRVVEHSGMLTWDGPRRRFRRTYGFDPWNGATPRGDESLAELPALARRAGNVLALDFDDAIRAVRRAEAQRAP